jgi:phosphate transport system substrate-binding protein
MRRIFDSIGLAAGLLVAIVTLAACAQTAIITPTPTTITIAGSTAMRPVLELLTGEFSRQHPDTVFTIRGGGSTLGEQWAALGQVDLAASTIPDELEQPPKEASGSDASSAETALVRTPIGLDGLSIIVHRTNPIPGLTLVQLRNLYSGRFLDWQDVGGEPGEVVLVSREDGSGSRLFFEERVMGTEQVSVTAVVMPTSRDVVEYVADHPQAIGYVTRAYVVDLLPDDSTQTADLTPSPNRQDGAPTSETRLDVKVVAVEGQLPELSTIEPQQYHLTRPLFLVSAGAPTGRVREFIDFVLSPQGQALVARYHIPVR